MQPDRAPSPPDNRPHTGLPHIVLLGTGGTIAGEGADPTRTAQYQSAVRGVQALADAVPALAALARTSAEQLFQTDSANLTDAHLLQLARRVAALCAQADVHGVVITHGSDTLQESAYLLHLCVPSAKPVVLTAAMRPPTALGADGPANLLHAVAVAAHPSSHGRGALVVMNEQIHTARDVCKTHSLRVDAFASPHGALGAIVQNTPRWWRACTRAHTAGSDFDIGRIHGALPTVGLVSSHTGMLPQAFTAWADAGARAIVYAGFGNGTVPDCLHATFAQLRRRGVWLVRCSRAGAGAVLRNGAFDDDAAGTIAADDQSPERARLLCALALARWPRIDAAALQEVFLQY